MVQVHHKEVFSIIADVDVAQTHSLPTWLKPGWVIIGGFFVGGQATLDVAADHPKPLGSPVRGQAAAVTLVPWLPLMVKLLPLP